MESLINEITERMKLVRGLKARGYLVCKKCGEEALVKEENGEKTYDMRGKCPKCGCKEKKLLPLSENDGYMYKLLEELYNAFHAEIHGYLATLVSSDGEKAIRFHIRSIMTEILPLFPAKEKKFRGRYEELSGIEGKTKKQLDELSRVNEWFKKFKELEDGYKALAAFRHFETFCLYIDSYFDEPIFAPSLKLFKGFYYYANSMVLNGDIKFISKQCFTGAGKSITDCALIAFIFGYNINSDILKVFGSKDNIGRCVDTVIQIMTSPQYAKVFPAFAKFKGDKSYMFEICRSSSGELKLRGSTKSVNLCVRSKEMIIDGIRAKFLLLDDITASDDAEKIAAHEKDIYKYTSCWFQRRYNANSQFIIASGTTYHLQDILSYLRRAFGADKEQPTPFPFTTTSSSDEIVPNGKSVFVKIYALDENDNSTYPERFSSEAFRAQREKNPRSFAAMAQQSPLPPEGSPFDMENLPNKYSAIPHIDKEQETCAAYLDPARKGADFQAMAICTKIGDNWFLKDCVFKQLPPDKVLPLIVDKIIFHKITRLEVENNIDTSLAVLIRKALAERGVKWCEITERYNVRKKADRVMDNETAIKSIYFPEKGVFGENSDMGKFMYWLNNYNYEHPPAHDDSVDALAGFAARFIVGKSSLPKIKILDRRR